MLALREKVVVFSRDLNQFSHDLTDGLEELKRLAPATPYVEGCREANAGLAEGAASTSDRLSSVEEAAAETAPLEEMLEQCLAQLKDNSRRTAALEDYLQSHGAYQGSEFSAPMESKYLADGQENSTLGTDEPADACHLPHRSQSQSSAGNLVDEASLVDKSGATAAKSASFGQSPLVSASMSGNDISPSLRELQLKYGKRAGSETPTSQAVPEISAATQAQQGLQKAGSWIATKLQEQSPSSISDRISEMTLDVPPSQSWTRDKTGKTEAAAGLDDARPPSTKSLTVNTSRKQETCSQGESGSSRSYFGGTPKGKSEIIASRLSSGEAPWDMLSLKAAINHAEAGEVAEIIGSTNFHPQAAAFTSLLHMCAKSKHWDKALEVFEGMKKYHPGVVPNTVHFSSLISACGTAGRWREAMEVFKEMKAHSEKDPQCVPNVITYSALMTACCSGGRPDKAHEVFQEMVASGIKPDQISYSTLIAGFERWGDMEKAMALYEEMHAAGLAQKPYSTASYLEQFSKKLQRSLSNVSAEAVVDQEVMSKKMDGRHRPWNSFASNGNAESPCIGAHYAPNALSRGSSVDMAAPDDDMKALRHDVLHTRSPSTGNFVEEAKALPGTPYHVPALRSSQQRQAAKPTSNLAPVRASRGRDAQGANQQQPFSSTTAPSTSTPLHYHNLVGPPPGFPVMHGGGMEMDASSALQKQLSSLGGSLDFGTDALSHHLVHTSTMGGDMASQVLDALQQMGQPMMTPQMMGPRTTRPPEAYSSTTKAAASSPQMSQVAVEEYNNLPLRFSRQLSLDQMNEAVDYINAVIEGKKGNSTSHQDGVSPSELLPLGLGNQRTTALLNCLLQLKRVRLAVRDDHQYYVMLPS